MTDSKEQPIPVGIDIGSLNARIAFCESPSTAAPTSSPNDWSQYTSPSTPPSIVPNEIGERYTVALATEEPKSEADPLNDEVWDLDHGKSKNNKKQQSTEEPTCYVYGEAARKVLHRLKKPLEPHLIHNSIQGKNDHGEEKEEDIIDPSARGYVSHLISETTNATHTHPSALRIVLSLPPSNMSLGKPLTQTAQAGLLDSLRSMGWESHPDHPAQMNKRDKKAWVEQQEQRNRIVGVLSAPLAACHAHSILDHTDFSSWTNGILVLDWGASSLSATVFSTHGGMISQSSTTSESSVSGTQLSRVLMNHVAETFERKNRIPKGDVLLNKKARAKLDVAATNALRTFGFSPKAHISIDGLFEGIDCHVEVTLPRFEMLCAQWLRKAEGVLMQVLGGRTMDVVLTCGNVMRMPMVKKMMDRLFSGSYRGKPVGEVPPEEAVAMGCAIYANILVSPIGQELDGGVSLMKEGEEKSEYPYSTQEENVALSPVGVGLTLQEQDSAFCVLVKPGEPLPAHTTKIVDLTGLPSNGTLGIVQIVNNEEKTIGKVEGFTASTSNVEITTELSLDGKLKFCIDGGPIVEL